jgi:hypothetical protein
MPRQYMGGVLPDYYIVDSDSHVDESKCELWRRFPKDLQPFAPRKFIDPNWKGPGGPGSGPGVGLHPPV